MRFTAGLLLTLFICGCAHIHQRTWHIKSEGDMRANLQAAIPPGTPLGTAQAIMESEGFNCELKQDASFQESEPFATDDAPPPLREHLDYLECRRAQDDSQPPVGRIWTVALVIERDHVKRVLVSSRLEAP